MIISLCPGGYRRNNDTTRGMVEGQQKESVSTSPKILKLRTDRMLCSPQIVLIPLQLPDVITRPRLRGTTGAFTDNIQHMV